MRIYVASSWRNDYQPEVVRALREVGHEVFDFRHPRDRDDGFHWSEIDKEWKQWTPEVYRDRLNHPLAEAGFKSDFDAMNWCEAVVAVQPFGRSSSLELGWAVGSGKFTVLLLDNGEPELMVKMVDRICCGLGEVLLELQQYEGDLKLARKCHCGYCKECVAERLAIADGGGKS